MIDERFSNMSIFFHWTHAIIIIFLVCWGWWMVDLPKGSERGFAFSLHKSVGMVAYLLLLMRSVWRFFHQPPLSVVDSFYFKRVSKVVHLCLYLLLFMVPIAGYLSASFTKYTMKFFGFSLPKLGWLDSGINEFFSQTHALLAWTLTGLVVVHVLGAIIHSAAIKRMFF
jgi:cytochrome b561